MRRLCELSARVILVVGWVGCWLLVVGCWLLVVGCWLLVVGCWLSSFVVIVMQKNQVSNFHCAFQDFAHFQ